MTALDVSLAGAPDRFDSCDVAIVGAGPVGLWLASSLLQQGVDARVVERSTEPTRESRAIGIHPPGLACLASIGAAAALQERGVAIRRAHAFGARGLLGSVSFSAPPLAFPFVLAVPQAVTEAVLERALLARSPGALLRGHPCTGVEPGPACVRVLLSPRGGARTLIAKYVVGCDGKNSVVRRGLAIPATGGRYDDHFLMGDVPDDTPFGSEAAVFLHPRGMIESFPLPGGLRRWVAATGRERVEASPEALADIVASRLHTKLRVEHTSMISSFTAERQLASRFATDRIALAGDAAHVVSPIGGQGMNLGWLDAQLLSPLLAACVHGQAEPHAALERYARRRRHAAKLAIRRAEMFMGIGRARRNPRLRDALVQSVLKPPVRPLAGRLFTMWGL